MPVQNFHQAADPTAHENFMRWCKENPDGRFIHFGPRGEMLHRVGCPHIANWNREEWGDFASLNKAAAAFAPVTDRARAALLKVYPEEGEDA